MRPSHLVCLMAAALLGGGCPAGKPAAPEPAPLGHRFQTPEAWAKEFDAPSRDAWQKPKQVVDAMNLSPGMTVADIGAGTGYFEPYLSRAVGPVGTVLAIDIEPEMVRYLRERVQREHLSNVRPVLATVSDAALPQGKVDRVLIVDTWHHIPDRVAYAERLRAALAPGGTVTLVDFTLESPRGPPREHRIPPDQALHELGAGGFRVEKTDVGLPDQYVLVARPAS